jgi:aquaporin Z
VIYYFLVFFDHRMVRTADRTGMKKETRTIPWVVFGAELVGTAILVGVGLSIVIFLFGHGSPVIRLLPNSGLRRLVAGFLFGSTGAAIALSRIGKVSGAHINPVVTAAFWLEGKLRGLHAIGYIAAQLLGGILGSLPLLLWGKLGASVHFAATLPGQGYGSMVASLGETVTTFSLIIGLFVFISHPRLRAYTPLLFPFLYAMMVYLEAPISGTSTNPARSLGPALISMVWKAWWVYWLGPATGMLLAVAVHRKTWLRRLQYEVAKLYHFEHDPYSVFRWYVNEETHEPALSNDL